MDKPEYSVVIPVYNSEMTIEKVVSGIDAVFGKLGFSYEIILVDDGSKDLVWERIQSLKKQFKPVLTAVRLNRNYGQHNATFCGLTFARGKWIITMDDDLQHPPDEIAKLIDRQQETEAEMVYGVFRQKKHSSFRRLGSKVFRHSAGRYFGRPSEGSSFRLISKSLNDQLIQHNLNFMFIDELLYWYTEEPALAEVEHHSRQHAKSGYSRRKLFKLLAGLIINYTNVPLKLMVYGGLFASMITFVVAVYYIILKIFFNVPMGYTSIIVGIMFSTSIILFSLGIIGEYLSRIYQAQNKKPPYTIRKIL
ncbi:MAG: glycosyltransferase family 2 protein [Bacteroidales bacterium]|nr:glycosyltransferase family 2 protein [Bacteroidales bacterium]